MGKIILLRGNSGSGKTTVARALQRKFGMGTLLISQDIVRREMLYVKDEDGTKAIDLMQTLVLYGHRHCDLVILEGILYAERYQSLFDTVKETFGSRVFAYYFDLSFEETLKRHRHKPNAHEFGEAEMRSWWVEKDYLQVIPEKPLSQELSQEEIIQSIYEHVSKH